MEKEKVLVVGTGKSGIAATQLLLRTGKLPVLFDSNAELDKDEILGKLSLSGDEKKQVEIVLGDLTEEEKNYDVAVTPERKRATIAFLVVFVACVAWVIKNGNGLSFTFFSYAAT